MLHAAYVRCPGKPGRQAHCYAGINASNRFFKGDGKENENQSSKKVFGVNTGFGNVPDFVWLCLT